MEVAAHRWPSSSAIEVAATGNDHAAAWRLTAATMPMWWYRGHPSGMLQAAWAGLSRAATCEDRDGQAFMQECPGAAALRLHQARPAQTWCRRRSA